MIRRHPFASAAAALVIFVYPALYDTERLTINRGLRKSLPGHSVRISDGFVQYELMGPADGDVVVFVHGFSSPYYIWGQLVPAVEKAGFRTLRYDLFGRGFSDRPDTVYALDLFDRQLSDLLDVLRIRTKVHLIGLSMGGLISATFADRHPERVASLTLMGPAGFSVKIPAATRLLGIPLLGEYLMSTVGGPMLLAGNDRAVHNKDLAPDLRRRFAVQMRYRGFRRAILSTLRNVPLADGTATYARLGHTSLPVMLVWGRDDQIVPFSSAIQARAAMPLAAFRAVDDAGHLPHYERPEIVGPVIADFLTKHRLTDRDRERPVPRTSKQKRRKSR